MIIRFPIAILLAALLAGCGAPEGPVTRDLITPRTLTVGDTTHLAIGDLFFADSYDGLTVLTHPALTIDHDPAAGRLTITPQRAAEGLTTLSLALRGDTLDVPLYCEIRDLHRFTFRPEGTPEKLTVFGSFNSWNRDHLPMSDPDGDGLYEASVRLEPGRYEYKFWMDGEEIVDPENPDRIPNPFGAHNSVLTVKPRHPLGAFLHRIDADIDRPDPSYTFLDARGGPQAPLDPAAVVALAGNRRIDSRWIAVEGRRVTVTLPPGLREGAGTLRVGVTDGGLATRLQRVDLFHGAPTTRQGWRDVILYSIMIDRFHDGDPDNTQPVDHPELAAKANFYGGDLEGILDKMKEGYFDSLGVNALWISPVVKNTEKAYREWPEPHRLFSGYHGYWPVDHTAVDPRFGDMNLLQTVVREAHRRDMKVLLDFVANHTHIDHPFFQAHREYYGVLDLPDGRKNIRFWDEHRLTTWFEPFLPSFDYLGSEEALQTMTDNAVWWMGETGIDGFRQDAVKHIPNRFWRVGTAKLKTAYPDRDIYQIGETFGGYGLISSYVNNGQLDGQFNFNLFYAARQVFLTPALSFDILAQELDKTHAVYGFDHRMGNLMDSHDQIRYMAYTDGDLALDSPDDKEIAWTNPPSVDLPTSYDKAQLYQAYLMTIPGIPVMYYGTEIGMTGADDPDNRRPMRFGADVTERERRHYEGIRDLVHLRREHSALRRGDYQTVLADGDCMAYLRSDFRERVLVVLNKSDRGQERTLALPAVYGLSQAVDLLEDGTRPIEGNSLRVTVPAYGYSVYRVW